MTTSPCQTATSHGVESATSRAGPLVGSPGRQTSPVPATVVAVPVVEVDGAQQVVGRVGDQDQPVGEQADPLRLSERRAGAVLPAALAAADPTDDLLAVEDHQRVVRGVGDEQPAVGQLERLAGEGELARACGRRDVRAAGSPERALGLVLGDELLEQPADPLDVALARGDVHDVALGVDQDQRRPGPDGVLPPGLEVRVVEDRVIDLVALDRGHHGLVVALVLELRRVHADDGEHVVKARLQRSQLVQDVQAVDAAERPKVSDHKGPTEVGEPQRATTGVEPAAAAHQLRSADPRVSCRHLERLSG